MTDFHTHILPCVDDGSKSLEESLAILKMEAEQGVDKVILTPHFYAFENSPLQFLERRQRAWKTLQPKLEPGMPQVLLGAEVHYFEGICAVRELMDLRIQGTELLLLEMPGRRWTERMVSDVLELSRRRDLKILLAHVERYLPSQPRTSVEKLLASGVLFQANVSFFTDWRTKRKALSMMEEGSLHFLGSDCHSMGIRRPDWDKLPAKAQPLCQRGERYLQKYRIQEPV